ncbi:MAG: Crp/Fnr family transcriptional regulator [Peptostreptococcus sp.]|uniref:Crp/Fnr family transcriptional regulator n=1 Tax=Peptostreptococcus sp. TaxID=1262 RepID=UPI002FC68A63
MKNFENIVIFDNIKEEDYAKAIKCLDGHIKKYKAKEYLNIDRNTLKAAIVLEGTVDLISSDEEGKMLLHERYFKNQSFVFDIKDESKDFVAVSPVEILILDLGAIFEKEKNNCPIRKNIMENIIKLQNNQSHELDHKVDLYLEKSLRKKIIKYFKKLEPRQSSGQILLPFKRCDLASYLYCDRSALSRELSRMENEGLIQVDRNTVRLIDV